MTTVGVGDQVMATLLLRDGSEFDPVGFGEVARPPGRPRREVPAGTCE